MYHFAILCRACFGHGNFGIAVNRRFRDASGEWRDDTCFVNVVAWQQLAERLAGRLGKGVAVLVEGRLQSRTWEAKDGGKRSTIEINAQSVQVLDKQGSHAPPASDEPAPPQMDDDEIPF